MRNDTLAQMALELRQTADSYLSNPNTVEVPKPAESAYRLRHLASQIETILVEREDPPLKPRNVRLRHAAPM